VSDATRICEVVDCERPAVSSPLCQLHRLRQWRGRPLHAPIQERSSPWGAVVRASISLADCPSEDDAEWKRRNGVLRYAVTRWYRAGQP